MRYIVPAFVAVPPIAADPVAPAVACCDAPGVVTPVCPPAPAAPAADDGDVAVAVAPLVPAVPLVPAPGGVVGGVAGGVVVVADWPGGAVAAGGVALVPGDVVPGLASGTRPVEPGLLMPGVAAPGLLALGCALVSMKPLSGALDAEAPGVSEPPLARSLPCFKHPV